MRERIKRSKTKRNSQTRETSQTKGTSHTRETSSARDNPMRDKPVFPLLISMAVPPMVSMMIQSMYNIVDSIFVTRMGQDALTAVSLAYPLQNLVLACSVGLGVGVSSCISRSLGAGSREEADEAASHGMVLTAIHALIFILVGVFGTRPFLRMFTQDEEILRMGSQYCYIVISLSGGSMFHICIEKLFQSTGSMVPPMILQGVGAVINIVLDPILIFGLLGFPALGVAGAGIATVVGQLSACGLAFYVFSRKGCDVKYRIRGFRFRSRMVKNIYSVAIPSGIMIALPSVLVSALNAILSALTPAGIAVFGLYYKLQSFVYMPASGLVQGMRPIAGYNCGAGLMKRLKETIRDSFIVVGVVMAAGTLLFCVFTESIFRLFDATPLMNTIGIPAFRIISLGFIPSTVGIILSGLFEALGRGGESLAVSLIRQLILTVPLSWLLAVVCGMGVNGVWITFPLSETVAAVTAFILYKRLKI